MSERATPVSGTSRVSLRVMDLAAVDSDVSGGLHDDHDADIGVGDLVIVAVSLLQGAVERRGRVGVDTFDGAADFEEAIQVVGIKGWTLRRAGCW